MNREWRLCVERPNGRVVRYKMRNADKAFTRLSDYTDSPPQGCVRWWVETREVSKWEVITQEVLL